MLTIAKVGVVCWTIVNILVMAVLSQRPQTPAPAFFVAWAGWGGGLLIFLGVLWLICGEFTPVRKQIGNGALCALVVLVGIWMVWNLGGFWYILMIIGTGGVFKYVWEK
jgi:hypothetical protein